jgi:S-adenosylmethionine decarboxylase
MIWICNLILICLTCFSLQAEESTATSSSAPYAFRGKHFIASYSGCDREALCNLDNLREVMVDATKRCGATILGATEYVFAPDGLTMVILLSESHASIHTYPEHQACFVDLFTCGDKCSAEAFDQVLQAYLKPTSVNKTLLERD